MRRVCFCALLGVDGVQSLDGTAHQHRKAMFLALMTPGRMRELTASFHQELLDELMQWQSQERIFSYMTRFNLFSHARCVNGPGCRSCRARSLAVLNN